MAKPSKNTLPRAGKRLTGQTAQRMAVPAIRLFQQSSFDVSSGALVISGRIEILRDIRTEGFVCRGHLRHINRGCAKACPCITCEAEPRWKGAPTQKTIETCGCIRCRRRREARNRAE